jgi:formate transporter
VMIAGAELFTGNTMLLIGNADKRLSIRDTLKNRFSVYFTNFAWSLLLMALVFGWWWYTFGKWAIGLNILDIAMHKVEYGFLQAFCLGILCNILVCLWVRLSRAGRTVADKVAGILFPVTAFVAAWFEHSVANMFYLPMAFAVKNFAPDSFWILIGKTANDFSTITLWNIVHNLIPVTLWNIVGGGIFVWLAYRLAYRKK